MAGRVPGTWPISPGCRQDRRSSARAPMLNGQATVEPAAVRRSQLPPGADRHRRAMLPRRATPANLLRARAAPRATNGMTPPRLALFELAHAPRDNERGFFKFGPSGTPVGRYFAFAHALQGEHAIDSVELYRQLLGLTGARTCAPLPGSGATARRICQGLARSSPTGCFRNASFTAGCQARSIRQACTIPTRAQDRVSRTRRRSRTCRWTQAASSRVASWPAARARRSMSPTM